MDTYPKSCNVIVLILPKLAIVSSPIRKFQAHSLIAQQLKTNNKAWHKFHILNSLQTERALYDMHTQFYLSNIRHVCIQTPSILGNWQAWSNLIPWCGHYLLGSLKYFLCFFKANYYTISRNRYAFLLCVWLLAMLIKTMTHDDAWWNFNLNLKHDTKNKCLISPIFT